MNIKPKDHYRRLEAGEKVKAGDLAEWKFSTSEWPKAVLVFSDNDRPITVHDGLGNHYYRLKTPSETFSEPKPPVGLQIKFKRLTETAKAPERAHDTDSGWDLFVDSVEEKPSHTIFNCGIAVEIPDGYFGLLRPRSSLRRHCYVHVSSGVIDSGYRGELAYSVKENGEGIAYFIGDKCCQLIILPLPKVEFVEVQELSPSPRGTGGHGSTGQ